MIYTAKPVNSSAAECYFRIKNYGDLPTYKQMRLEAIVAQHFALVPIADAISDGMLVMHVIFAGPIHIGQYTRRLEMLMFQLRCAIDPLLTFSTELVYA